LRPCGAAAIGVNNTFRNNQWLKATQPQTRFNQSTMGDKSPKSVQKQASQKQSKNDVANKKKQDAITAQQATKAKAAALKKK